MFTTLRLTLGLPASLFALLPLSTAAAAESESIVVTATGIRQDASRIGDSVTVLESEDIRTSQLTIASDLVARTPGVTVTRNGGFGSTTSIRIRGAETDQTVVLFDGIKLNDASAPGGGYDFAHLILDDESRIEILRGPQSVLWGSQAIGGVVNIITREPAGPLSGLVKAELGGRETGFVRGRVESGGDRFAWRVGATYYTTDGVSAFDEDLGGRELDGYRNTGADVRASWRFSDAVTAEVRARYADGESEFDGYPAPLYAYADTPEHGESRELVAYSGLNVAAPASRWTHRVGYAYTDTDRQNFNPLQPLTTTTFRSDGRTRRAEYFGTLGFGSASVASFGLQSETAEFTSSAPSEFDPAPTPIGDEVRLDSVFAQVQVTPVDALTLTGGLRYDDHETFGNRTTPRVAAAWSVTADTLVRASFGGGFKAPSLYQLYSDYGNTALRPETAKGWDLGIEQRFADDRAAVSATWFQRSTRNMIDFFSCFGALDPRCVAQPAGFYDNIARTRAEGVELGLALELSDALRLQANYTRLKATNDAAGSPNFGRDLPRRPEHVFNVDLAYAWSQAFTTGIAVQRVGRSFDNVSNSIELDAYTKVDLRIDYAMGAAIHLTARLENAFDEDYATSADYGSVGRTAYGGVRVGF